MSGTTISPNQLENLKEAHSIIGGVLASLGVEGIDRAPDPKWKREYRRMWQLLKAVERHGGDLSLADWRELGIEHGYDPRGLGGFFNGYATMESHGDRRVLTDQGRRWIRQWEPEFGPYQAP